MNLAQKIVCLICFLTLSTPIFALKIHCKQIAGTSIKQCISTGNKASKLYGLTRMPYALCSKTLCTLDKKHPRRAHCTCSVYKENKGWRSLSISPNSYKKAKPQWSKQRKLLTVQSNYSLANMAAHPHTSTITCRFKKSMPWADCFGVRCTINGPHTAICLCPVYKNKVFAITGPGDIKKCLIKHNQAWSAILVKNTQANGQFVQMLYYQLYPNSPVSNKVRNK